MQITINENGIIRLYNNAFSIIYDSFSNQIEIFSYDAGEVIKAISIKKNTNVACINNAILKIAKQYKMIGVK